MLYGAVWDSDCVSYIWNSLIFLMIKVISLDKFPM